MKKVVMIFISSILLIVLSGCSLFEEGNKQSYNVDDYKIIEIYYGDAINQELIDQLEDSEEIEDLISNASEGVAYYKPNRMCGAFTASNGGYRMLNETENKYLAITDSDEIENRLSGVSDGKRIYCSDESEKDWDKNNESAESAYNLADILMSETKSEITDTDELNRYNQLLTGEGIYTDEHGTTYGILNIKFVNQGTTRLVRIYEVYDEDGAGAVVEQISYIQITLSNDTDKFDELYDEIYEDVR